MSSTATEATSASTSSFVSSLIFNSALAGGELVAFILLRRWIKALYEPRTYIPPTDFQAPVLGRHLWKSLWQIVNADPIEILHKNGVDPYVFVRFLIMMTKAMVPIWLLSWIILLPVDSANSRVNGKTGLDLFTFGNVATAKQSRYWAHLVLCFVFNIWIMWLIWGEMRQWLIIRQRHLISPNHSKLAQANTVLVTGIPRHYLDEEKLAQLFSHLPGGVRRIWLNRNLKDMPNLYDRRTAAVKQLESSQVDLIKFALKHKVSREQKIEKLQKKSKPVPETLKGPVNPQLLLNADQGSDTDAVTAGNGSSAAENGQVFVSSEELGRSDQLVPRSKRPTCRLKPKWAPFGLGFLGIGKKVDAIDWARQEIAFCNQELEKARAQLHQDINTPGVADEVYPPLNSAFIHFNQQIAAHMAQQCLTHNQPYAMNARYIEQSPGNVIWRNLSLSEYEKNIRQAISWAATVGLIILWATPVAFVGVLSNVTTLTSTYPWLDWISGDSLEKKALQGVISGILPPLLLALLMQLLPVILRQLAALEGIPSKTGVELDLMTRYFIFLLIHTFFIVTLASGLISSVQQFANSPESAATTLASQMPTASTFFITLILTQFTGTMGDLLRIVPLILYYFRVIILGGSPRSVFTSRYRLNRAGWGKQFPKVTVYAVIMIAYCVISPIINGFGAAFFFVATIVFKYLYIWVIDQPPSTDTGGLFFPKAITHVFVGMYVQEVCMTALFFLARNDDGDASAIPQGALMIVLIVATAACHYTIIVSYNPLKLNLPLSLAHLSQGMPEEDNHEGSVIGEDYDDTSPLQPKPAVSNETKKPFPLGFLHHRGWKDKRRMDEDELWRARDDDPEPKPKVVEKEMQPGEALVTGRDYATKPHGNDVELGVGSSPASNSPPNYGNDDDTTTGSPTSPGPPITTSPDEGRQSIETSRTNHTNDSDDDPETHYFAVPGGPGVLPRKVDDINDQNAFFHPATKEAQRIIWLPRDELGLCMAELEMNERGGVRTSSKAAWLNSKGKVQISGPPPDDL